MRKIFSYILNLKSYNNIERFKQTVESYRAYADPETFSIREIDNGNLEISFNYNECSVFWGTTPYDNPYLEYVYKLLTKRNENIYKSV